MAIFGDDAFVICNLRDDGAAVLPPAARQPGGYSVAISRVAVATGVVFDQETDLVAYNTVQLTLDDDEWD